MIRRRVCAAALIVMLLIAGDADAQPKLGSWLHPDLNL